MFKKIFNYIWNFNNWEMLEAFQGSWTMRHNKTGRIFFEGVTNIVFYNRARNKYKIISEGRDAKLHQTYIGALNYIKILKQQ